MKVFDVYLNCCVYLYCVHIKCCFSYCKLLPLFCVIHQKKNFFLKNFRNCDDNAVSLHFEYVGKLMLKCTG